MNADSLNSVLLGALTMSAGVIGFLFLRFWTVSRERLFAFFAFSFWLLGLNWLALALVRWSSEEQHQIYLIRLVAFGLIIAGIIDKNRRARIESLRTSREASRSVDGARGSSRAS